MHKPKRVPLRLTALEALEPRTPLHGAPHPGTHFGDRGHDDFDHGPQRAPRIEQEMVSVSFSRPPRESRSAPVAEQLALTPAISPPIAAPPVQVVIVITMPAETTLTFTPAAVSQVNSVVFTPPRSSSSNLRIQLPQLAVTRSPAALSTSSLANLSSFSALLSASSVRSELSDGSEADSGESAASATESTPSESTTERNATRSAPTHEPPQQTQVASDDPDELIELNPDDEHEKAKRKGPRTASSTSLLSSAREEFLRSESQFNGLSLLSEHLPNWQRQGDRESLTLPVNDDLIELLAEDQAAMDPVSDSASSFEANANTQLEATLGLATDVELLDEAISELAAAIAADSLSLGSLPAAEPK